MNKRNQAKLRRKVKKLASRSPSSSSQYSASASDSEITSNELLSNNIKGTNLMRDKIKQLKEYRKDKATVLLKKELDKSNEEKLNFELKLEQNRVEMEKLTKELNLVELKLKGVKVQSENYLNEINSLKKKESEAKDKELNVKKGDEEARKALEARIRQLTNDLNKQIANNKVSKAETDKLNDKLKVCEEKLSHTERDNGQKKQLIDFYKKKLEETSLKNDAIIKGEDDCIENDLKNQLKKINENLEKSRQEVKSLKSRLQSAIGDKSTLENKNSQLEKSNNELGDKYEALKKDKSRVDMNLKQCRQKLSELETYAKELETTAEAKISQLSESSQQTIALAQIRLKYAFKSVDSYEKMFKYLYESLIERSIELRRDLKSEQRAAKQATDEAKTSVTLDDNMKMAINLASTVLNLSSNELDDILSSSVLSVNENDFKLRNRKVIDLNDKKEDEVNLRKISNKLMFEFEQRLNSSRKEKHLNEMINSKDFEINNEQVTKDICELIFQRLNDVLSFERQLASLHTLKKIPSKRS